MFFAPCDPQPPLDPQYALNELTGRSTSSYIILYQGGTIDHLTHVPGPVSHPSVESEYNEAFTAVIALSHFTMLNN